jgi:peptide/nickel transport system substrate-binding protein
MKNKFIKGIIITAITAIILSGCSKAITTDTGAASTPAKVDTNVQLIKATDASKNPEKAKSRANTFVTGLSSAPGGVFLPYFYENGYDGNATGPIFASLVILDSQGKPKADLAERWEISSDNLVYTYHLKKGLKFSNGTPVTAADVQFTLTLLADPAYAGYSDISTFFIKGTEDYKKGNATSISGIKVIDDLTVEITTEKVNAQNLLNLGGQVISKAYYGKDYIKGKLDYLKDLYPTPMGAGAYKFVKYIPGQEIHYAANENYYGGKPSIENLIYKVSSADTALQLFQTGETDTVSVPLTDDNLEALKNLGFANIQISTANNFGLIYFNNGKPTLKETAVRQALYYGLDREKLVTIQYQGHAQVANVPNSPLSWAYTEDGITKYGFDPTKAKKLLDDAGWKVGANGIREKAGVKLKLNYLTRKGDDVFISIAKENYKDLGIDFTAEMIDFDTEITKFTKGDYDLAAFSTSLLTDPNDAVSEFLSTFPQNYSKYSNPKVDKLIKDGISTTDLEKRKAIYKDLYKEFTNDPPVLLTIYKQSLSASNARIPDLIKDGYNNYDLSLPKIKISK